MNGILESSTNFMTAFPDSPLNAAAVDTSAHPAAAVHALIAAGGSGSRAGGDLPKQYRLVGGMPMLERTRRAFHAVARLKTILVMVAPDDRRARALPDLPPERHVVCARAGATRAATVRHGLDELIARGAGLSDWVLVHDAARCLITPALIDTLIQACEGHAVGGLLAVPLADTLKQGDGQHVRETLSRSDKWLAQTPQMFRLGVLRDALMAAGEAVTDESSAVEALGLRPLLVTGSTRNFKVTWPEDFALADALINALINAPDNALHGESGT